MNVLLQWASENPYMALALLGVLADLLAGTLPDKYAKWPGAILTVANKAYMNGKQLPEQPLEPISPQVATVDLIQHIVDTSIDRRVAANRKRKAAQSTRTQPAKPRGVSA